MASAQTVCAESIALLYLLHSVPTQVSANPSDTFPHHSEHYILPFEKERFLTSTLAFLSSIDDNPNHIPAVCVQEDPDAGCLKVFIAVNKAKWGDGHLVLQDLKHGFERIFSKLSVRSCSTENEIFTAIVLMCSERITSRLRLLGRKASNQSITSLLQKAIRPFARVSPQFTDEAKRVSKLLDQWAKHQTLNKLQFVVQGIYKLSKIADITDLFDAVPNREMDPSSRRSLLNMIKKVARYRSAARFLHRTAKKFPIARTMEAVPVTLPRNAFQNHPFKHIPAFNSFLKESGALYGTKKKFDQLFRLLQCNEQQASDLFVKQTTKTLSDGKIHAEIQLIFHCEAKLRAPFPRVISSSKDACFLCNAFIQIHGKFYTPRCHGRLYPGWRLPACPETAAFEQRFIDCLQKHAQNSIQLLFSRRKRTIYPDPNESTVMTIPITSSTLSSVLLLPNDSRSICALPITSAVPHLRLPVDLASDLQVPSLPAGCSRHSEENSAFAQLGGKEPSLRGTTSKTTNRSESVHDEDSNITHQTARNGTKVSSMSSSATDSAPFMLSSNDLPFCQRVTFNQRPIQLSYEMTTFLLEFGAVKDGQLCITHHDESHFKKSNIGTPTTINILDIPTNSELNVESFRSVSQFSIRISPSELLDFEFAWDRAEATHIA